MGRHRALHGLWLFALAPIACADAPARPAMPSKEAPISFALPSNDGALVTVPLKGASATVLDFFGPTCEPCKKKVPELVRRRPELEARGGKLVLIAVLAEGETTDDATKALASWGASAPFLVDRGDVSAREAGVHALPSTILLGADGSVRWRAPATATVDDILHAMK